MNKKMKICIFLCVFTLIAAVPVYVGARTVKGVTRSYEPTETTTEAEATTVTEKESETTTLNRVVSVSKKIKGTTTTTEAASMTTTAEAATETTTINLSLYEGSVEISTISIPDYPSDPVDKNGNPLTGIDLKAYNAVKKTFKDKWTAITSPKISEETLYNDADHTIKAKTFAFDDGDIYTIKRYTFGANADERLTDSLTIAGNTVEIRYMNDDGWYMSGNPENTDKKTMFIDTDKVSVMISIPAVYTNNFQYNTLQYHPDMEEKAEITINPDNTVTISWSFPQNTGLIGEIWYLCSENKLADWNNGNHFAALAQDLAVERRFSWDGYYFPIPANYIPNGDHMLYRQPSNYTGASFTSYGDFPAAFKMGYVMTYTCMLNQNEKGYWATMPKSGWLSEDFNIGGGFYDTRFNTDFAENLLSAYKRYNNDEFLFAACKYAEYFIQHANTESYTTKNGGLLVQDYGYDYDHLDTHVSLNHQLAELDYLYKLYQITREDSYRLLADQMLIAINDTKDQWVLANNNLNYALYYVAGTNPMVDYPYLTYNDLFETQELYTAIYGKENETVKYLMDCKLQWMTENSITGYRTK